MQKKIGIDARFYNEAGPGRYVKNIISHLEEVDKENKYLVFLTKKRVDEYEPKNPNFQKVLADYPWYSWSEQTKFLVLLLKNKLDLLYVPHFNIPILYPKKIITAIPDLIMHKFSTDRGTTLFKPYFWIKKFVYKFVVWWAVLRSYKVIVPSKDAENDFNSTYPVISKNKIIIATEGFDPDFSSQTVSSDEVLKNLHISKPFLLYISSMYEHKNVRRLVDSFKIMKEKNQFLGQMILVGKNDNFSQKIGEYVKEIGLEDKILLPGLSRYITDEETVALRKEALIYVFPSLKEGFSLTPLEAQYFDLPCAISDIPCHREIYEETVVYFDPLDVNDMVEKISDLINDLDKQEKFRSLGKKNLSRYTWNNTAEVTLSVFKDLFKNS